MSNDKRIKRIIQIVYNFLNVNGRTNEDSNSDQFVKQYYAMLSNAKDLEATLAKVRIPLMLNAPPNVWTQEGHGEYQCVRMRINTDLLNERVWQALYETTGTAQYPKYATSRTWLAISRMYKLRTSYVGVKSPSEANYHPPVDEEIVITAEGLPLIGTLTSMNEMPLSFRVNNLYPMAHGMVRAYVLWKYSQAYPECNFKVLPPEMEIIGDTSHMEYIRELDKAFEVVSISTHAYDT